MDAHDQRVSHRATPEAAEGRLAMLVAPYDDKLQVTRRWSETYVDATGTDASPKRMVPRLDFSCAIRDTRLQATAEYTDSTDNDFSTMRQTREISGTLWTDTQAHAETAATAFLALLLGTRVIGYDVDEHPILKTIRPQRTRYSHSHHGAGGRDQRHGGHPDPVRPPDHPTKHRLAAGQGGDQRQCEGGEPWHRQSLGAGQTGAAPGGGHETEQPRETQAPDFLPMSGTEVALWTFTGSYGWTYATLDNIW